MKRFSLALLVSLATAALSLGDKVTLKDGKVFEGTIQLDTPDLIEIKWRKGGIGIVERIPRSQIAKVEKDTKEDLAFRSLGPLAPAPDRLTPEDYLARIAKCKAFLNVFPKGTHEAAVNKMLAELTAEHKKAEAGGLKLKGKWIDPESRARNAYEIDAGMELDDMQASLNANNFKNALRHFEKIQSDFSASEKFPAAREGALKALKGYRPVVRIMQSQMANKVRERQTNLLTLPVKDRAAEKAAQEKADAGYKKLIQKEKTVLKTKWLTLNEYQGDAMRQTLSAIESTLKILNTPPSGEPKLAGELYRNAWDAARKGEREDGTKMLSELRSLQVPSRYLVPLEELLKPADEPDEPVIVPGATPDPVPVDPKDKPTEKPKDKPKESPKSSDDSADEDDPYSTEKPTKKKSPMQMILVIVLVAVIAGALIAAFAGKKK